MGSKQSTFQEGLDKRSRTLSFSLLLHSRNPFLHSPSFSHFNFQRFNNTRRYRDDSGNLLAVTDIVVSALVFICRYSVILFVICIDKGEEDEVTAVQRSSSLQLQVNTINGCACFQNRDELEEAVRRFIEDGCSDGNNCNNTVVQKYGWPIGTWCVSSVTDMNRLFRGFSSFNDDLSSWDVSSVANMLYMLADASSFNQDLSPWNFSSVTDMGGMFSGASSFNQDLSSWDVSSVIDMRAMFGAISGPSSFNQDLSSWNVSSMANMREMFYAASSFNQDLSAWDVSSVADMGYMFSEASSFNRDLSTWNVPSMDPGLLNARIATTPFVYAVTLSLALLLDLEVQF